MESFETLALSGLEASVMLVSEGKIVYAGGNFERYRKAPSEFVGKTIEEVFDTSKALDLKRQIDTVLSEKIPFIAEEEENGVFYASTLKPVCDSRKKCYVAIFSRDITVKRNYEDRLNAIREFEKIITEIYGDFLSADGKTESASFMFERALRRISTQVKSSLASLLFFDRDKTVLKRKYSSVYSDKYNVLNEMNKNNFPETLKKISEGKKVLECEEAIFPRQIMLPVIYGVDVLGALLLVKDGDDEWKDEDLTALSLAAGVFSNAIMRRRVDEIFNIYTKELEENNEEIKSFSHIITHDLRAPLSNIKGFAEVSSSKIQKLNTLFSENKNEILDKDFSEIRKICLENLPRYIGHIKLSSEKIERLSDAVLSWVKTSSKGMVLEEVDLNSLIRAILETFEHAITEASLTVRILSLPVISADKNALTRIFTNLIDNAIKYRKTDIASEIIISSKEEGDFYIIYVKDNGIGVGEEEVQKIFTLFYRSVARGRGDGVGLAYVKTLMEKHGGSVRCESDKKGSTFILRFPKT